MKSLLFNNSITRLYTFPLVLLLLACFNGCGDHSHDHDDHDHPHESSGHDHDLHGDHGDGDHDDHGDHDHDHDDHADHGDQDHAMAPSEDDHGHGHGAGISVTQFTTASELFMEYEPLVEGHPTELIIHLTRLSDWAPITQGSLEIRLVSTSGEVYSETESAPARDGIFLPVIRPTFAGTVRMELHLTSSQLEDIQIVKDVQVFSNEGDVPHTEESTEDPNAISFLKEQQWKIDYAVESVEARPVYQATSGVATLTLPAKGEAVLPAPASGILRFHEGDTSFEVGERLQAGQRLFYIEPDSSWQAGLAKLGEDYQLAQAELERVRSLQEKNAVSQKRVLEAEVKIKTLRTALQQIGGGTTPDDLAHLRAVATAPFDGIMSDIFVKPGQRVEAGEPLALVLNPNQLVLEVQVLPSRLPATASIVDATFRIPGGSDRFNISELGGRLISQVPSVIPGSNVAVVRFMFENPEQRLVAGTKAAAYILSGQPQEDAVAVPKAAIHEEEGIPIVYVHAEGETIEKRFPKLGNSDGTYVQALSGIEEGERVVTKGATFIRLSNLSTAEMGHGHAH